MRRFYAPKNAFIARRVTLDEGETRHLRDVLRLRVGDVVGVFDGEGREFECAVTSIAKRSSEVQILHESAPPAPESSLDLTLAAAVTKGDQFDMVVQKSVELGVNRLVPLVSKRCEVKMSVVAKKLERWRKIALEAAKQCGRARLMSIGDAVGFVDFFSSIGDRQHIVLFSERGGDALDFTAAGTKLAAVIGPKGGWDDAEIELAKEYGASVVTLGGRILRAETAAIALTAILQHRFGDMK